MNLLIQRHLMDLNPLQLISLLQFNWLFGEQEPMDMSILVPETLWHDTSHFWLLLSITKCSRIISYIFCPRARISHFSKKSWILLGGNCDSRPQSFARNDHCYTCLVIISGPFQWTDYVSCMCVYVYTCAWMYTRVYILYVYMHVYIYIYVHIYFYISW